MGLGQCAKHPIIGSDGVVAQPGEEARFNSLNALADGTIEHPVELALGLGRRHREQETQLAERALLFRRLK